LLADPLRRQQRRVGFLAGRSLLKRSAGVRSGPTGARSGAVPRHEVRLTVDGARRGGSFINMSSSSAHRAGFNTFGYEVAKAAVVHLTRCAAIELGEKGVRVNSI